MEGYREPCKERGAPSPESWFPATSTTRTGTWTESHFHWPLNEPMIL